MAFGRTWDAMEVELSHLLRPHCHMTQKALPKFVTFSGTSWERAALISFICALNLLPWQHIPKTYMRGKSSISSAKDMNISGACGTATQTAARWAFYGISLNFFPCTWNTAGMPTELSFKIVIHSVIWLTFWLSQMHGATHQPLVSGLIHW